MNMDIDSIVKYFQDRCICIDGFWDAVVIAPIVGCIIITMLVITDEIMMLGKKKDLDSLIKMIRDWDRDWRNYDKGVEPIKPKSADEFKKEIERLYHIERKNNKFDDTSGEAT